MKYNLDVKFTVEIGNIGLSNTKVNKFSVKGDERIPEIYAYNDEEHTKKYSLAFFNTTKDGEADLHLVGGRAFGKDISRIDFMKLASLGYTLIVDNLSED